MKFDRDVYFDMVRGSLFGGKLTQQQVDGQNGILAAWEKYVPEHTDLRWLAYMLATTLHETASTMWPIAEYGAPTCNGASYAKEDPETKQRYYGRGFVQLTWRDNYARADKEMNSRFNLEWNCEWVADNQLKPEYAAPTMYLGMTEGWFRSSGGSRETLARYFNDTKDDAYTAREIINGDKSKIPSWSNGVSIGNLIKGYHGKFLAALHESVTEVGPEPIPPTPPDLVVRVIVPPGVRVVIEDA